MTANISLGQYLPGNSVVHRLDPRRRQPAMRAQRVQAEIAVDTARVNLGYTRILAPLSGTVVAMPVEEGQTVSAGDVIGCVGTTSAAEIEMGPHLHFSVSRDGAVIDPHEYVSEE